MSYHCALIFKRCKVLTLKMSSLLTLGCKRVRGRTSHGRVASYLRYLLSLSGAGHDNVPVRLSVVPTAPTGCRGICETVAC